MLAVTLCVVQINMQHSEAQEIASEQQRVTECIGDVNMAIDRMKRAIKDKVDEIEHAKITISSNEVECHELELRLVNLKSDLLQSKQDRERACYMEEVLAKEAKLEQQRAREATEVIIVYRFKSVGVMCACQ